MKKIKTVRGERVLRSSPKALDERVRDLRRHMNGLGDDERERVRGFCLDLKEWTAEKHDECEKLLASFAANLALLEDEVLMAQLNETGEDE